MDFFKSPHEEEKHLSMEELEYQKEKDPFSYDSEKEDKYTYKEEIVAQSGDNEI